MDNRAGLGAAPPIDLEKVSRAASAAVAAAMAVGNSSAPQASAPARKSKFSDAPPPGGPLPTVGRQQGFAPPPGGIRMSPAAAGAAAAAAINASLGLPQIAPKKTGLDLLLADEERKKKADARNAEYLRRKDAGELMHDNNPRAKRQRMSNLHGGLKEKAGLGTEPKSTGVYVTGIPDGMDEQIMSKFFSKVGPVVKAKLYKKPNGELKGDCLIMYKHQGSANAAVNVLNGSELIPGVKLHVTAADFNNKAEPAPPEEEEDPDAVDEAGIPKNLPSLEGVDPSMMSPRAAVEYTVLGIRDGREDFHVVIINGVWTCKEVTDDLELGGGDPATFFAELESEMVEEFSKHGTVLRLAALTEVEAGPIGVRYPDPIAAARCVDVMDGRGFAGRTLKAFFYDGSKQHGQLPPWQPREVTASVIQQSVEDASEEAKQSQVEDFLSYVKGL